MRLAFVATVFFTALNNFSAESESSTPHDHDAKPEVAIKKTDEKKNKIYVWAGVILNNEFVLSTNVELEGNTNYDAKGFSVIVGYNVIGELRETKPFVKELKELLSFDDNKGTYEADKIWTINSLLLIKTKTQIQFTSQIGSIYFPRGKIPDLWKNPNNIPQNKNFTTSYWCRDKNGKNYKLQLAEKERKCNDRVIFRDQDTFPACMPIRTDHQVCLFPPGSPLTYNGTLVGVRKGYEIMGPYGLISDDYFINVVYHRRIRTEIIQCILNGKTPSIKLPERPIPKPKPPVIFLPSIIIGSLPGPKPQMPSKPVVVCGI